MLNDDDESADATQEVFIKLHDSLKRFRGDANLYTYIYRIATNVAISYLRKRKVRAVVRLDEIVSNMLTGGNEPQRDADRDELKRLSQKQSRLSRLNRNRSLSSGFMKSFRTRKSRK